jgi:hypothetical protein
MKNKKQKKKKIHTFKKIRNHLRKKVKRSKKIEI